MPRRKDQLRETQKKKHRSVIIAELKDTWPEITGSQRLDQNYQKNNKY